ncbi:ABC transporter substrate-binding protein [Pseudothermotoga sp.]|nr:sugar ABC transporter substrate-binding protein [Pseudothermotoga sp.]MDW8139944.1 sugar ABC transporter substrate-binding protein [Pseudothermotoga sp.]
MRRLLIVFLVALIFAVGFGKTKLRVCSWAGALEAELDQKILAEFMRTHPDIEVVYEPIPQNYYQKILTDIAAGTPPDVFLLDAEMVPRYSEEKLLLNLAPYLSRLAEERVSGTNLNEYFEVLVDIFRAGRSIYALPKDTSPVGVFYNKKLFDRFGVPYPPESGWTWKEFEETAAKLTKDTDGDGKVDVWAFSFPSWVGVAVPLLWAGGGEVFSPDFTYTTGYLNSETNVKTYSFFVDLFKKKYAPSPEEAAALGGASSLFFTGRIGMVITGRWFWLSVKRQIEQGAPIDVGIAPIPHAPGFKNVTVTYASGWAVPANVADKRLAVELAAWLSSEYAQRERCLKGGLAISANKRIAEEQATLNKVDAVFIKMLSFARVPVGSQTKYYRPLFERTWAEAVDRILIKGVSVKEAFDWAAEEIDKAIKKGEWQ